MLGYLTRPSWVLLLKVLYELHFVWLSVLKLTFRLCLRNFKLCEKCNLLLGLLFHFLLPTRFLMYYFFRFIALVFTNTFSFVFVFFGAFTKCKSLGLLLILPAAVSIMWEPPYRKDCVIFNSVNRPVKSAYKANVFNKFLIFLTNFSVNVYVTIDISMNSLWKSPFWNFQVTDFCNILRHIVKSKVIQTFTKLLKSESVNKNDLINSVYLWLNFSILFSHVFLKSRRDCRLKSIFMCIVFLCSFFYSPFKHKSVYNDIKLCHQVEVFTPEYLNANNKLHEAFLNPQYTVLTILKLKQINNKPFYCLLIILQVT